MDQTLTTDVVETGPTPGVQDPMVPQRGYWAEDPGGWERLAYDIMEDARRLQPRIVFLGDSITQGWGGEGRAEWEARFGPLRAANLGIGGDRTQQILWRIERMGTLDGLTPELVVLKIGVNNIWVDAQEFGPARVAEGVAAVVAAIRAKCPGAKVLALGILPTQADPANPLRAVLGEINALSAASLPTPDGRVRFADLGEYFVEPDGTISSGIMPDACHLSPLGYHIFADALEPLVKEILNEGSE